MSHEKLTAASAAAQIERFQDSKSGYFASEAVGGLLYRRSG